MKKTSHILVVLLILVALAVGSWFAPFSSEFVQTKTAIAIGKVLGKKGVTIKQREAFMPIYQTTVGIGRTTARAGYIESVGSFMSSPSGFNSNFVEVGKTSIDIEVDSLITDIIVINDVQLDGFKVTIEDDELGNNVEVLVQNVVNFVQANKDEIMELFTAIGDEETSEAASKELSKLFVGDIEEKYINEYKKLLFVMFGGNAEVVDHLMAFYSTEGEDPYSEEMEYWSGKEVLVKNFSITNSFIVNGDDVITIPALVLKDIGTPMAPGVRAEIQNNEVAMEVFEAEFTAQEEKLTRLESKGQQISQNLAVIVQELMMEFMMLGMGQGGLDYQDGLDSGAKNSDSFMILNQMAQIQVAASIFQANTGNNPKTIDILASESYLQEVPSVDSASWKLECSDEQDACVIGLDSNRLSDGVCGDIKRDFAGDPDMKCAEAQLRYRF